MRTNTKERIVNSSATLFRRQGYSASGVKQIVAEAEAPFSSLYHFFPRGKDQLAGEVIRSSGLSFQELVEGVFDAAPDILTGVHDCFAGAAETLRQTNYADACPIATVALEVASTNEPLRLATAEVFESWIRSATEHFPGERTRTRHRHDRRARGRVRAQPGHAHDRATRRRRHARRRRRRGGPQACPGAGRGLLSLLRPL
jgi:AcrR family transcriptional regulator